MSKTVWVVTSYDDAWGVDTSVYANKQDAFNAFCEVVAGYDTEIEFNKDDESFDYIGESVRIQLTECEVM